MLHDHKNILKKTQSSFLISETNNFTTSSTSVLELKCVTQSFSAGVILQCLCCQVLTHGGREQSSLL